MTILSASVRGPDWSQALLNKESSELELESTGSKVVQLAPSQWLLASKDAGNQTPVLLFAQCANNVVPAPGTDPSWPSPS